MLVGDKFHHLIANLQKKHENDSVFIEKTEHRRRKMLFPAAQDW